MGLTVEQEDTRALLERGVRALEAIRDEARTGRREAAERRRPLERWREFLAVFIALFVAALGYGLTMLVVLVAVMMVRGVPVRFND